MRERIQEAKTAHKNFKKAAVVLKNLSDSPYAQLMSEISVDDAYALLEDQFNNFLINSNVQEINCEEIKAGKVMARFFNAEPPFGPGKKKYQFRDAFSFEGIRDWVNEHNDKIYLLAGDSDLEKACETERRILYIKEFENLEFWLEDEWGEVLETSVHNVEILNWHFIATIAAEEWIEVSAKIGFSAEVSYDDPDMTYYDKEEDEYFVMEQINTELERETEIDVEIFLSITPEPVHLEINRIKIMQDKIPISVQENQYPYK